MERIQPLMDYNSNDEEMVNEEEIFARDDKFFREHLEIRKEELTDEEYVKTCI